uniref:DUF4220 domain-containing protein n=1 Tax=Arundo donax TaxID=35708 RepID=A0A0A8Z9I4_ARUDO
MGFNPPVPQRDSDWEIRVAVLLSLLFQVLLIFIGPTRKRTANPLARFASWSCYLLADWVADLALGLLVNNLGNIGGNSSSTSSTTSVGLKRGTATLASSGSPGIFAFWTPFLLLHLGGPDTITAYSIEDNELWLRHLIGLLFQLFAACVIFSCSLKGNPMIPATVLMYLVGIIKYSERTYSLYSSSVDGVLSNILPSPNPGLNYAKLMTVFSGKEKAGLVVQVVTANGVAIESKQAREQVEIDRLALPSERSLEAQAYYLFKMFRSVCYDINLGHKARKMSQAFFLDRKETTAPNAFKVIEVELNFVYDMVHTKEPVAHSKLGYILRFIGSTCIISSVVAFFRLDKGSIHRVDVAITYALLLGGLVLDVVALAMLIFCFNWTLVFLEESSRLRWLVSPVRFLKPHLRRWSEMTSQMNLIGYCLGKPDGAVAKGVGYYLGKHGGALAKGVGSCLGKHSRVLAMGAGKLREIFDDLIFVRREPLRSRETQEATKNDKESILLKFIFDELKDTAIRVQKSTYEEMRKACSYRGERVLMDIKERPAKEQLQRKEQVGSGESEIAEDEVTKCDILVDSVTKWDFDESLLMWHIATELCFVPNTEGTFMTISKTLSEYMLYLLVKQPKILAASAGVGQRAYQDTCAEARRFFKSAAMWDPDQEDARRMLLNTNTSVDPMVVKGGRSRSVLFHACILAKELRGIDEEKRWKVVARVWMEMLTYAAAKCKGTTHVHQLARGGELITMVWLLMAHMGIGNIYQKEVPDDANPKIIVHDQ